MPEKQESPKDNIHSLIDEGKAHINNKSPIKAFFPLEKAYSIMDKKDSEVESLLLDSSYKGIWGAYGAEQFELMEYLARFSIQLLEEKVESVNDTDKKELILKLAKSYNGLALSMYQLGKRSIDYNIKSGEYYNTLISSIKSLIEEEKNTKSEKALKDIAKSKIKNDFGLIINLGFDGDFKEAIQYAEQAIALAKEHKLFIEEGLSKKIMGNLLFYFKDYDKSFKSLFEAVTCFQQKKSKEAVRRLGELYLLICENYFKLNEFDKGIEYLNHAESLFIKEDSYPYLYYALLGSFIEQSKGLSYAKDAYIKAIAQLNITKWGVQFETNVDSFLKHKDKETIYLKVIQMFIEEGEKEKAFETFETFRSKLFVENILSGKRESFGEIPVALKKERDKITKQLIDIYSKGSKLLTHDEITRLEKELYYCDEKIATIKGSYRGFTEYQIEPIEETRKKIPDYTLVIEYFYHNHKFFIFLISKHDFRILTIETNEKELEEIISSYLTLIKTEYKNPNWDLIEEFYKQKLLDILIYPVQNYLKDVEKIIIIPYKILHSFPIHYLFYTVDENLLISYLPNLQSINLIQTHSLSQSNPILFGDPRNNLQGSKEEVEELSALFTDALTFIGNKAQKEKLLTELPSHPMLHYSGHIRYNPKRPLYSYMECSEKEGSKNPDDYFSSINNESVLYLKEIYQLNLENLQFLSLSGCSSGVSTQYRGEEIVGLVRGFFYTGVQSILASFWDIEDQSSKDFLVTFFKKTFECGGDKKKGFQQAYFIMKEKYKHPFFYGGLSLYESF